MRIEPNTQEPRYQRRLNSDVPVKKKPGRLVIHFTFFENKNSKSQQERAYVKEQDPHQLKKSEKPPKFTVFDTKLAEQQRPKSTTAEPFKSSSLVEFPKKTLAYPTVLDGTRKKFFGAAFALVLAEEILRLVSYATRSPFSAYLDGNICVKILNQAVTPYVASMIVFVLICTLLFVTTKLASSSQMTGNLQVSLLKGAIPIGIFTIISATYLYSIINWILILTF